MARLLPPALELVTAYTAARDEPGFYWAMVQRVLDDCMADGDPAKSLTELLLATSALSGVLLQDLSAATGSTTGELLTQVHRSYLDADPAPESG